MMRDVDLEDAIAGSMLSIAAGREKEYLALFELNPPFWFSETVPPREEWDDNSSVASNRKVLQGMGGSGCSATGIAKVLLYPTDRSDF